MTQFALDAEQVAKVRAWMAGKPKVYTGPIGGRLTYSFTPTSIGVAVSVKDCVTVEELDITDYEGF